MGNDQSAGGCRSCGGSRMAPPQDDPGHSSSLKVLGGKIESWREFVSAVADANRSAAASRCAETGRHFKFTIISDLPNARTADADRHPIAWRVGALVQVRVEFAMPATIDQAGRVVVDTFMDSRQLEEALRAQQQESVFGRRLLGGPSLCTVATAAQSGDSTAPVPALLQGLPNQAAFIRCCSGCEPSSRSDTC